LTAGNNLIKNEIHNLYIELSDFNENIKIKMHELKDLQNEQRKIMIKINQEIAKIE
jgi:hypothetical protein